MTNKDIVAWLTLGLGVVLAVGSACFLIGQKSKETSILERKVDGHDAIIKDLCSTTAELKGVVDGKYTTIMTNTADLKQGMETLRRETRDDVNRIQESITYIRMETNALREDIKDLQKDVNHLNMRIAEEIQ